MADDMTRRKFLGTAGAAAAVATAAVTEKGAAAESREKLKIVGVSCSVRKGKTTAAGLAVALEAARAVAPERIETELVELAGLEIPGSVVAGVALAPGRRDDFPQVAQKLADPRVSGIIVGTPVYFANMSSLCKAFLDRCAVFRKNFGLSGKVAGVLAVGGVRNGGQELTIQSVQAALLCQEMILVGDGRV